MEYQSSEDVDGELPFEAADFMPVTRDLSPKKTEMILQWLDDPKYTETSYDPGYPSTPVCEGPEITITSRFPLPVNFPRCQSTALKFREFPGVIDKYFSELKLGAKSKGKPRALRGFVQKSRTTTGRRECLKSLQDQLQILLYSLSSAQSHCI